MAALETLHEKEQNDNIMVSWAYSGRDDITYKDTIFPVTKELPVAISFDKLHTLKERMDEVSRQIRKIWLMKCTLMYSLHLQWL